MLQIRIANLSRGAIELRRQVAPRLAESKGQDLQDALVAARYSVCSQDVPCGEIGVPCWSSLRADTLAGDAM